MNEDATQVSEAVVVWTGYGQSSWPVRDQARLAERYGPEETRDLLPRVRQLEEDFYNSDARLAVPDLATMGEVAAGQFRQSHPEVSEEAVKALAWCYAYDYK